LGDAAKDWGRWRVEAKAASNSRLARLSQRLGLLHLATGRPHNPSWEKPKAAAGYKSGGLVVQIRLLDPFSRPRGAFLGNLETWNASSTGVGRKRCTTGSIATKRCGMKVGGFGGGQRSSGAALEVEAPRREPIPPQTELQRAFLLPL